MVSEFNNQLNVVLETVRAWVWGVPFLGYILVAGLILTVALRLIQFRGFFASWRAALGGSTQVTEHSDMSPFHAFLNSLSVSIGNGALAGTAAAIYVCGPGAAFWIFAVGLVGAGIRFAEIFLTVSFAAKLKGKILGGPFLYIKEMPLGKYLVYLYAGTLFAFGLI